MKKFYFASSLIAMACVATGIAVASAYAGERSESGRLPQVCEAIVYSKIDKQLPEGEFVTQIRRNSESASKVEVELLMDQGNDNFCPNSGEATIREDGSGACEVIDFKLANPHFDCG